VITIILVTLGVTLLTTPLNYLGFRTQVRQAKLRPALEDLRRRHRGDRARLAQESASLLKANGISPLAGCLPMLIQAPVFIAAYQWVKRLTASSALVWGRVDLAQTGIAAMHAGAVPMLFVVALVVVALVIALMQARVTRPVLGPPAHRSAVLLAPGLAAVFALALPIGVAVYTATSSAVRLGQYAVFVRINSLG
jgi:YidC/Oxa1 family membrane protein insertase